VWQNTGTNSQVIVRNGVTVTNNDPGPFAGGSVSSNGISMTLANSFVENGKTYWIVTGYSGVTPSHLAAGANAQHDVLDTIFNNGQDTTDANRSFFSGGYTFILPTRQELIDLVLSPFPTGLFNGSYWSATLSSANSHELVQIFHNTSQAAVDSSTIAPVIVQVLPVVIDLNRDGILSYGQVTMDVNGDGLLDLTKWAGAQDGVLVWDKYADGLVHDNSQYAFAQYATTDRMDAHGQARSATDLEGLADAFDSNRDGVFDAQDAEFERFAVWQDVNGDGVSQVGEVISMLEWRFASIDLVSDGVVRTDVVGVTEAGRTAVTFTDGSTTLAADVAFAYQTLDLIEAVVLLRLDGNGVLQQHAEAAEAVRVSFDEVWPMSGMGQLWLEGVEHDVLELGQAPVVATDDGFGAHEWADVNLHRDVPIGVWGNPPSEAHLVM
jgi:hypothetical protein